MSTALIIVDVQNDFCEGGALAVSGGNRVAEQIAAYRVGDGWGTYRLVVASRDWHKPLPDTNCGHFAADGKPDFVKSWPEHCVANTSGANLHPAIAELAEAGYIDATVNKGHGAQSYSAIEGATADSVGLLGLLRSHEISTVEICGLAFDYCVKATALDSAALGFRTRVLANLTASVAPTNTLSETNAMMNRGVLFNYQIGA